MGGVGVEVVSKLCRGCVEVRLLTSKKLRLGTVGEEELRIFTCEKLERWLASRRKVSAEKKVGKRGRTRSAFSFRGIFLINFRIDFIPSKKEHRTEKRKERPTPKSLGKKSWQKHRSEKARVGPFLFGPVGDLGGG